MHASPFPCHADHPSPDLQPFVIQGEGGTEAAGAFSRTGRPPRARSRNCLNQRVFFAHGTIARSAVSTHIAIDGIEE
jgi:hypothetical protein